MPCSSAAPRLQAATMASRVRCWLSGCFARWCQKTSRKPKSTKSCPTSRGWACRSAGADVGVRNPSQRLATQAVQQSLLDGRAELLWESSCSHPAAEGTESLLPVHGGGSSQRPSMIGGLPLTIHADRRRTDRGPAAARCAARLRCAW
jgi:hypothetical protein